MKVPKKPSGRKSTPFYWWRRFKSHKYKPWNARLLTRIRNGDFEYPKLYDHAEYELHWMKEEQEEFVKNYKGIGDPKRDSSYQTIEIRYRKRHRKLTEDAFEVDHKRLQDLLDSFCKEFIINKEELWEIMEEFGGTTEELYIDVSSKFEFRKLTKKKALEIFRLNNSI